MRQDSTGAHVSRTDQTKAMYRKRYLALARIASEELGHPATLADITTWLIAQDGRWADASFRQYRAATNQAIEDALAAGEISTTTMEALRHHVTSAPVPYEGEERTSAKKRKTIRKAEFVALLGWLFEGRSRHDDLIATVLMHNAVVFLRPREYARAWIEGTCLYVENAKATNGRANGRVRDRDLAPYGNRAIASLRHLLVRLHQAAHEAGGWDKLWGALSARLARVCKNIRIERVSFYTSRHQGMANAKQWMTPEQVAAAAGHRSSRTAVTHYARRRSGWGAKAPRAGLPSARSMSYVVASPKATWGGRSRRAAATRMH